MAFKITKRLTVLDNTTKFNGIAAVYAKARPDYAPAFIDWLYSDAGMKTDSVVADIGSGTGIFSKALLERGGTVYGVEPNADMRITTENTLCGFPNFHSVDGTAENTTLAANSVDFITVAQAFHWFDFVKTRVEFKRILKDQGRVFLVWNKRLADTEFMRRYESILRADISEYREVSHTNVTDEMLQEFLDENAGESKYALYFNSNRYAGKETAVKRGEFVNESTKSIFVV